jgi:hypothetical protein
VTWLGRIADYERPWVGRVGLALVIVLWLFGSAVGFGFGVANGLAVLIGGAAFISSEVWIERSGERHPKFVIAWRLGGRIGVGVLLIVLGIVRSRGWDSVVMASFGAWMILWGLVLASFLWLEPREAAGGGDE